VEVGIAAFHSFYYTNWPYQMAAAVSALVPIVVVFFVAQRWFVRGIQLTGMKGSPSTVHLEPHLHATSLPSARRTA